jgi:hypothetical protein
VREHALALVGGSSAIAGAASAASAIARSIVAASASGTRVASSPLYLSNTSRSVFGTTASPPRYRG